MFSSAPKSELLKEVNSTTVVLPRHRRSDATPVYSNVSGLRRLRCISNSKRSSPKSTKSEIPKFQTLQIRCLRRRSPPMVVASPSSDITVAQPLPLFRGDFVPVVGRAQPQPPCRQPPPSPSRLLLALIRTSSLVRGTIAVYDAAAAPSKVW